MLDAETWSTIRRRRAQLARTFDGVASFDELEESMVPSYCHRNPGAAAVSWWRLLAARRIAAGWERRGPVLDFGAGTGELFHLLGGPEDYRFVEESELCARALREAAPTARRETPETLPAGHFGTIFALDSLEHNRDPGALLDLLVAALAPAGWLVISGPTESALYRLGRRIAGFHGHYHAVDVYAVERAAGSRLRRRELRRVPPLAPLFRISAWVRSATG